MSAALGWGLLSTARINRALIGPIRQAARSRLVAVASRDPDRARAYAAEHGIPRAYGSYEELLADPEIDVVYVPLPNWLHCEWTVRAAERGKHVLCEKPLVPTLAELDRIESAAAENGVTVFEAFMYLHHPQTLEVRDRVRQGGIGQLRLIRSWFHFHLPPERSGDIRLRPEPGGGSLWDVGVYPVSLSIVMADAGPPVEVWGMGRPEGTGVDLGFAGQMRFANGVVAQISSGFDSPLRQGAHLVGSAGAIEIDEPWRPGEGGRDSEVRLTLLGGREERLVTPAVSPFLEEVEAMEACVLDGASPVVPLRLSRDVLGAVLALRESAAAGRPVRLGGRAGR